MYFWGRGLFCKTATVTKATIAMTPITVMMMVTGLCQGFFSFISVSVGGKDRQTDRKERREGLPGVGGEGGRWGQIGGRKGKERGCVRQSCIQM